MEKLTLFYLEGCPYCRNAMRAVKELEAELGFDADRLEWVEERKNAAVADRYDYYNVPSVFFGDEKLYECKPGEDFTVIKHRLRRAIETAIEA